MKRQMVDSSQLPALKSRLRTLTRGAYEIQESRITTGLRVLGAVKSKLGIDLSKKEKLSAKEIKKIFDKIKAAHTLVTAGTVKLTKEGRIPFGKFKGNDLISDYALYSLISNYIELERQEATEMSALEPIVEQFPIHAAFLKGVLGCGPRMSAVVISEINPHRAKYVSSIWKYAGLDVGPDGRGRGKYKEHLIKVEYIDKKGQKKTKDSITYNPWLKSKLTYVLGGCLIKAGGPYVKIYRDFKLRLENHAKYGQPDVSKGHRHAAAIRYMIKCFLRDLYNVWWPLEGLEVFPPYSEAKLGHRPHGEGQAAPRVDSKPFSPEEMDELRTQMEIAAEDLADEDD